MLSHARVCTAVVGTDFGVILIGTDNSRALSRPRTGRCIPKRPFPSAILLDASTTSVLEIGPSGVWFGAYICQPNTVVLRCLYGAFGVNLYKTSQKNHTVIFSATVWNPL